MIATFMQAGAAVVIVHFRSYADLESCLASVHGDQRVGEVVVIDQSTSAREMDRLSQAFPRVRFVGERRNPGFAAGVNRGVRLTTARFVLLLNPDCVLCEPIAGPLSDYLDADPTAAVVGPRLLNEDGTVQPSARRFPDLTTAIAGRRSWLTALAPGNWLSKRNLLVEGAESGQPREVDWVSGACMMIRRAAFEQVGGLDEEFFLYWEDADFCRRLKTSGWRTIWHAGPSAVHLGGRSSRHTPYRSVTAFHVSAYRYLRKHARPFARWTLPVIAASLFARCVTAVVYRMVRARRLRGHSPSNS